LLLLLLLASQALLGRTTGHRSHLARRTHLHTTIFIIIVGCILLFIIIFMPMLCLSIVDLRNSRRG